MMVITTSLPLAVILVVPMCLLCSVAGVALAKMDINIFVQIGFVVLVGLASKNAILIVEFAKHKQDVEGLGPVEAAIEECDRFYPAFQFVLWGDKSPSEALAAAMVDAAGEA